MRPSRAVVGLFLRRLRAGGESRWRGQSLHALSLQDALLSRTHRQIWGSGSPHGAGRHGAAGASFWNIPGKKEPGLPPEGWGPPGLVFVGLEGIVPASQRAAGWHYEAIRATSLAPPNLHLAQLQRRLAATPGGDAGQPWTTTNGWVFAAKFGGLSSANAIFILPDGRRVPYPSASLSAESRALATKLATPRSGLVPLKEQCCLAEKICLGAGWEGRRLDARRSLTAPSATRPLHG